MSEFTEPVQLFGLFCNYAQNAEISRYTSPVLSVNFNNIRSRLEINLKIEMIQESQNERHQREENSHVENGEYFDAR
ncbi:hypothetical protein GCM10010913_41080 [Paenibacillus aceti]|uniref:Uncharacterized protein n=1 Tax=Paenibacillus aceti TaxID=1820010 RepID=A0ABQ1W5M5_9BACL|nr:hypothetical protein GCM10010913_41080 [Paenibacillus aceti]